MRRLPTPSLALDRLARPPERYAAGGGRAARGSEATNPVSGSGLRRHGRTRRPAGRGPRGSRVPPAQRSGSGGISLRSGSTIASPVSSSRRSSASRARISPPRYVGPTPLPVKPKPWWIRPREPKIGRWVGETSIGPAPGVRQLAFASCGNIRAELAGRSRRRRVEVEDRSCRPPIPIRPPPQPSAIRPSGSSGGSGGASGSRRSPRRPSSRSPRSRRARAR